VPVSDSSPTVTVAVKSVQVNSDQIKKFPDAKVGSIDILLFLPGGFAFELDAEVQLVSLKGLFSSMEWLSDSVGCLWRTGVAARDTRSSCKTSLKVFFLSART